MLFTFTYDHQSQMFICSNKEYYLSAMGKSFQEAKENLLKLIAEYKSNNSLAINKAFNKI